MQLGTRGVMNSPVGCIPGPPQGGEGWCPSWPAVAHSWLARWGTWTGQWAAETPGSIRVWVPRPTRSSYRDSRSEICKPVNDSNEMKKLNSKSKQSINQRAAVSGESCINLNFDPSSSSTGPHRDDVWGNDLLDAVLCSLSAAILGHSTQEHV